MKGTNCYFYCRQQGIYSIFSQDDLVLIPKSLARNLSDISPLLLVKGVAAGIQVLDPFTGEVDMFHDSPH